MAECVDILDLTLGKMGGIMSSQYKQISDMITI